MTNREIGKRFTQVYMIRGEPKKDSKKARFRLAKLSERSCPPERKSGSFRTLDYNKRAQDNIENDLGIRFATASTSGHFFRNWEWFFNRISVTEMLDSITVIARSIHNEYEKFDRRAGFLQEAQRIFREENLAYEIDEAGGIHPLIDTVFSAAIDSAIVGLDDPRYTASLECVSRIDHFLLKDPQDYIGAIRSVFGACENTFKLMYQVPRLDSKSAGENISRDQQSLYEGHPSMQGAGAKVLESFKDWINAAHFYRHEQGVEEPSQPAPELGILLVSQGLSFVRWLAALDKSRIAQD